MRQHLSTRTLGILAVCLATVSAMVSWRSAVRYQTVAKKHEREIVLLDSARMDLQHNMVGLAALVHKMNDDPSGARRITPADPRVAEWCEEIESSIPRFRIFETIRADEFLFWYHTQMKRLHPSEVRDKSVLVAGNSLATSDHPRQDSGDGTGSAGSAKVH